MRKVDDGEEKKEKKEKRKKERKRKIKERKKRDRSGTLRKDFQKKPMDPYRLANY